MPRLRCYRLFSALLLFVSAAVCWLMMGCASPGPPKPPSLHLPEIPSDVGANRVGDEVRLRWTTSSKTTDELGVTGTITAQLCRNVVPASGKPSAPCTYVRTVPVVPGPSTAVDPLPTPLATGPATVLAYRIELRNAKGRSAGLSTPLYVAGGIAPPEVSRLQAKPTERGALLLWQPEDAADSVELERTQTPATTTGAKQKPQSPPVHLVAARTNGAAVTPFAPDAGGMIDTTAHRGETYTYTAQRVRHVVVGGHALELRSAPSPPVTVAMRDTFPPHPPDGLEAIATTLGEATSIDLSWKPNTEDDLAGYLVYRQELTGALPDPVPLTPSPVLRPAFRDAAVLAGHAYRYTVVAVDTAGNRSSPSTAVREEVPAP